jgi:hypothetical protein
MKSYNKNLQTNINNIINKLENIIGKNIEININNNIFKLYDNIYIIDHNYLGNKIDSFYISDNEMKIKLNHSIFNQDVYYYEDTSNQVTVYYSTIDRFLLGYKESSKDYVKLTNTDCYIKIHYSLFNQLRLFGFNYINYKIDQKNKDINAFINNILRNRLQNLKNALSTIQQIIYQVKNNFSGSNLNSVAKYYQSKIKSINTYDSEGEKIFKHWNILNSYVDYFVVVESNKTWQNNKKKFNFNINKFDKFSNKIIYIKVEDMPEGKKSVG